VATVETNASDFRPGNANTTIQRVTTQARAGSSSLEAVGAADASDVTVLFSASTALANYQPVTAGKTYSFEVWSKAAAVSRTFYALLVWRDAAGVYLAAINDQELGLDSVGGWTRMTIRDRVAPPTAAYADLGIGYYRANAGETHYYDCGLFCEGPLPAAWVPPVTLPNGKPVVQFDGAWDVMGTASKVVLPQPNTYYIVMNRDSDKTVQIHILSRKEVNDSSNRGDVSVDNPQMWSNFAGASLRTASDSAKRTGPVLLSGCFDGAASNLLVNGALLAQGNAGAQVWYGISVGGVSDAPNVVPTQGSIAAVLVYSRHHTDAERKQVEAWLGSLYGITVAL